MLSTATPLLRQGGRPHCCLSASSSPMLPKSWTKSDSSSFVRLEALPPELLRFTMAAMADRARKRTDLHRCADFRCARRCSERRRRRKMAASVALKFIVRNEGPGRPVVFLHGLLGSSSNFRSGSVALAKQLQTSVYSLDQRNHGASPHHPDMTYDSMAQDLLRFVDDHQLQCPDIIGHSMGGKTAMRFALANPERLRKLVVADIAPVKYPEIRGSTAALAALETVSEHLPELTSRSQADELIAKGIPEAGVRAFLLQNLVQEGKMFKLRLNLEAIRSQLGVLSAFDLAAGTAPCKNPTLFVYGSKSDYVRPQHFSTCDSLFPNNSKISLDAGHWLHHERAQEFQQVLTTFLAGDS
eukprot:m.198850 g.198850  ORF g.198850 m.198850 type:complete len:356 (-) comp21887_c0_seq1:158-1225(-)